MSGAGGWRYLGDTTDGGQVWWAPGGEFPPDPDELAAMMRGRGGTVPPDRDGRHGEMSERERIPGWEGSIGPGPGQHDRPHVYARDTFSGAGNCCCGRELASWLHVQAAPGVPVPPGMRRGPMPGWLADVAGYYGLARQRGADS